MLKMIESKALFQICFVVVPDHIYNNFPFVMVVGEGFFSLTVLHGSFKMQVVYGLNSAFVSNINQRLL